MEYYPVRDSGNCLWPVHGAGQGKFLMLGHLDTVYPEGVAAQRPLRSEGNKLIGPGVGDMKGGLSWQCTRCAGYSWRAWILSRLAIFFGCDEEIGSPVGKKYYTRSSKKRMRLGARRRTCQRQHCQPRKGVGQYTFRVRGHSAHAGVEPEKGANAILELAHQVIALHKLNGIAPGVTVNADVIHGGTRTNVVPDEAHVVVDVRAVDPQGSKLAHDAIMAWQTKHTSSARASKSRASLNFRRWQKRLRLR